MADRYGRKGWVVPGEVRHLERLNLPDAIREAAEPGLTGGEEMPPFDQFEQQALEQAALDAQQAGQLIHVTPSAAGEPL